MLALLTMRMGEKRSKHCNNYNYLTTQDVVTWVGARVGRQSLHREAGPIHDEVCRPQVRDGLPRHRVDTGFK
jgi:hypothetical protein